MLASRDFHGASGLKNSLHAKVRSGLLWSAVQNWGLRLSGLLLFMVMTRLLTPEQLGLFQAAAVVLTFVNMLADQGLTEAVVQRETITPEQMNSVFWLNMGVSLAIMAALWGTAPLIANRLHLPELTQILRVSSLSMPLTAASFGQLAMRKRGFHYRWLATASLTSTLVSGLLALAMAYGGFGTWSLVAQSLVASVITSLFLWYKSDWKLGRQTDFRSTKPLMTYGGHRLITYLLDFANTRYIELFLVSTLGPAALALYATGGRVYQALMQALSSTVLEVAQNGFSRLANDRPALIQAYYKSITITAAFAVPVFCLIAAVAQPLTLVLFDPKFAESAEVMRFMCMLGAVQVLQFYNGTVYNAIGKPQIGSQFMIIKVILTFGGLYLGRNGGVTGLLTAYIISQLLTTPLSFYLAQRLVGISMKEIGLRIWPFIAASVTMIAVALGTLYGLSRFQAPALILLICSSAAGGVSYLLFLWIFARPAITDAFRTLKPKPALAP